MFSISSKGVYGLAALFELALSKEKRCVQIEQIAKRQNIPSDYLRQLLPILKRSHLIQSVRGVNGGYSLKKDPSIITVREIIESLEGPIRLIGRKTEDKTLSNYWDSCEKESTKPFDMTLEQLVQEKQRLEQNIVYHI